MATVRPHDPDFECPPKTWHATFRVPTDAMIEAIGKEWRAQDYFWEENEATKSISVYDATTGCALHVYSHDREIMGYMWEGETTIDDNYDVDDDDDDVGRGSDGSVPYVEKVMRRLGWERANVLLYWWDGTTLHGVPRAAVRNSKVARRRVVKAA